MIQPIRTWLVLFLGLGLSACGGFAPEEEDPEDVPDPGRAGSYRTIAFGSREWCAIRSDRSLACHTLHPTFEGTTEGPPREGSFLDVQPPCALREDGSIVCWDAGTGLPPPPEGTFERLARGLGTSGLRCALRPDHTVACSWPSSGPAVDVPPDRFVDLATGGAATCGVREEDATLLCWSPREAPSAPLSGRFVSVAPDGSGGGCAVAEDGSIQCWGGRHTPPAGQYTSIVLASSSAGCAIRQDGAIACWGSTALTAPVGSFVQLALGDSDQGWALDPDGHIVSFGSTGWPPPFSRPFVDITPITASPCLQRSDRTWFCGWNHERANPDGVFDDLAVNSDGMCGLRPEGHLECWNLSPGLAPPEGTFTQVVAGPGAFCAIREDGEAVCWGGGDLGALSPPAGPLSSIVMADRVACALTPAGAIRCWGEGDVVVGAPAGDGFRAVTVRDRGACAIRADGHAQCWAEAAGWATPPPGPFADVGVSSDDTACALREADGSLTCWDATEVWEPPPELSDLAFRKVADCGAPCAFTRGGDLLAFRREPMRTTVASWWVGQ